MSNQNKGQAEQFVLRGNADIVIRQLVDEYNSSNGWQVNRIVNNILNFTVVLERNTKQAKEPEKASKDVEATDTTQEIAESDATEEAVEAVKVNVKPTRKAKPQS